MNNRKLAPAEVAGLVFMCQEEKLARDVYLRLREAFPLHVFDNIADSEQRHLDAVRGLLHQHGIAAPASRPVGVVDDDELQALHDELVARGLASEEEALRVGALIEEMDILDLQRHAAETSRSSIRQVYENLERASRNHLRAFVRQLARRGVSYQPQRLAIEDYRRIVSSPQERGRGRGRRGGGCGRGRGWRRGCGEPMR
jgi:hypothetical protein